MFDWIVVNVVEVASQIVLITNHVLAVAALQNSAPAPEPPR